MSRYAIGYTADLAERPAVVFMEAANGVWMLERGGPAPRIFEQRLDVPNAGATATPGEEVYFDVVLDAFSTNWVIRTVAELDPPGIISAMLLHGDDAWDALPRTAIPA